MFKNKQSNANVKRNDEDSVCILCVPDVAQYSRCSQWDVRVQGDEGKSPEVPIMLLKFHYKGSLYLPRLCSLPLWLTLALCRSHLSACISPSVRLSPRYRCSAHGDTWRTRFCREMEVWRGTSEVHSGTSEDSLKWCWDVGGSCLGCTASAWGINSWVSRVTDTWWCRIIILQKSKGVVGGYQADVKLCSK